jgi:hypothetical protein
MAAAAAVRGAIGGGGERSSGGKVPVICVCRYMGERGEESTSALFSGCSRIGWIWIG